MPSAADLQNFQRMRNANDTLMQELLPKVPELPPEVKRRFPSLLEWEKKMEEWRTKANLAIRGGPQNS